MSDIPPIREGGVTKALHEDQDPIVVKSLGASEDPSGAPIRKEPRLLPELLHEAEELQPGLQERPNGRVGRAQSLGRELGKGRPKDHRQTP